LGWVVGFLGFWFGGIVCVYMVLSGWGWQREREQERDRDREMERGQESEMERERMERERQRKKEREGERERGGERGGASPRRESRCWTFAQRSSRSVVTCKRGCFFVK